MRSNVELGTISGIEIGLHYSWFIIAALIAFSLSEHFRQVNPSWGPGLIWIAALVTAALFFVTLLLHELAHSLVAQARGLKVSAITLFALGGVSQIQDDATDAKTELLVAIAGPIASLIIGFGCLGIALGLGWQSSTEAQTAVTGVLVWLGYINIALAVFNQFVAFLFILDGIWQFFSGAGFGGLWIAFIGWFLMDAAKASYADVEIKVALRGVRVSEVMSRDCAIVSPEMSLQEFVNTYLLRAGERCFAVEDQGHFVGLITPRDVGGSDGWDKTTVREAMRPLQELHVITPDTPVLDALKLVTSKDVNQLPVVANGILQGVVSRSQLVQLLQVRSELHLPAAYHPPLHRDNEARNDHDTTPREGGGTVHGVSSGRI